MSESTSPSSSSSDKKDPNPTNSVVIHNSNNNNIPTKSSSSIVDPTIIKVQEHHQNGTIGSSSSSTPDTSIATTESTTSAVTSINNTTDTTTTTITTMNEKINQVRTELASYQRVSHKLASIDTSIKLSQVLDKLLPKLLIRIHMNQQLKNKTLLTKNTTTTTTTTTITGIQNEQNDEHEHEQQQQIVVYIQFMEQIHMKLIEMLSHTLKRVRVDSLCSLPCLNIIQSLFFVVDNNNNTRTTSSSSSSVVEPSSSSISIRSIPILKPFNEIDPFTMNLSLMFLAIGIPRLSYIQLLELLPYLLQWYGNTANASCSSTSSSTSTSTTKSQQHQIAHLLLSCIELITLNNKNNVASAKTTTTTTTITPSSSSSLSYPEFFSYFQCARSVVVCCNNNSNNNNNNNNYDVATSLYQLFLDILLYQPQPNRSPTATATATDSVPPPPPGLSQMGHERLLGGPTSSSNNTINNNNNNNNNATTITWGQEIFYNQQRIIQMKLAILDFIAPSGKYGIFLSSPATTTIGSKNSNNNSNSNNNNGKWDPVGVALTVALLIVGSSDENQMGGITEKATLFLKLHVESYRGSTSTTSTTSNYNGSSSSTTNMKQQQQQEEINPSTALLVGNKIPEKIPIHKDDDIIDNNNLDVGTLGITSSVMISCATGLLALCLGQTYAESVLLNNNNNNKNSRNKNDNHNVLFVQPRDFFANTSTTPRPTTTISDTISTPSMVTPQQQQQQQILATKRRPVSDATCVAIMNFIGTKILDDHPQLFFYGYSDDKNNNNTEHYGSTHHHHYYYYHHSITSLGFLAVQAAKKIITSTVGYSGLSFIRAKPYIGATRFLNSIAMKFGIYYDTITNTNDYQLYLNHTKNKQVGEKESDEEGGGMIERQQQQHLQHVRTIETILAQTLALSCSVLTSISTQSSSSSTSMNNQQQHMMIRGGNEDGSILIRDHCYGVICTLSRSQFASIQEGYIFAKGIRTTTTTATKNEILTGMNNNFPSLVVSIETSSLLFGCAANEIDRLRPRAVAALDALLGAYTRAYVDTVTTTSVVTPFFQIGNNNGGKQLETTQKANHVKKDGNDTSCFSNESTSTVVPDNNPWLNLGVSSEESKRTNESQSLEGEIFVESQQQSVKVDKEGLAKALLPLIWSAGQHHRLKQSRVAASRWASVLLKDLTIINACHILCYLAGDSDSTVASIAREGLGIHKMLMTPNDVDISILPTAGDEEMNTLPNFSEFTRTIYYRQPKQDSSSSTLLLQWYDDFSLQGKEATLRFTLLCMLHDFYGGEDVPMGQFLHAIQDTLRNFETNKSFHTEKSATSLLDECSLCLLNILSSSRFAREQTVKGTTSFGLDSMKQLCLQSTSSRTRKNLASASKCLLDDMTLWQMEVENEGDEKVTNFESWLHRSGIDRILLECVEIFTTIDLSISNYGKFHGCAVLGAHAANVFIQRCGQYPMDLGGDRLDSCWRCADIIVRKLGEHILHSEEAIGNACTDGLALAFSCSKDTTNSFNFDPKLYTCASSILHKLTEALGKFGHGDSMNIARVEKVIRAAGICLAASTSGSGIIETTDRRDDTILAIGPARLECAKALYSVLGSNSIKKEEEIAVVVGEALGEYADALSTQNTVWKSDMTDWPTGSDDENFAQQLPPHEQVLFVLLRQVFTANTPHKKAACAPALLAVVSRGSMRLLSNREYESCELVQSLLKHIDEIQSVFLSLLSYPKCKQLSRESCCLGIAACRGLLRNTKYRLNHDTDHHKKLLRAFGQTTNYGGSAMMETPAQAAARRSADAASSSTSTTGNVNRLTEPFGEESEEGGAAGLGEAALGAYREMAAASVSLGREDVLYSLLFLSTTHIYWTSVDARHRYSSATLLGENSTVGTTGSALELRNALKPHLGKLLPRILRACHDPNKQTRDQMNSLWVGITGGGADGRAAITNNFLATLDTLLGEASSKLWRARVGACGALSEVIVGREWIDFGGGGPVLSDDEIFDSSVESAGTRLLRLWRISVRSLDDVRGSVRESGETLARAVRGLTIRLCDPSASGNTVGVKRGREELSKKEKEATAAAATTLRWLIKHGMNQSCDEATGICISTLVEVVGVVKPKILEPSLPNLLRSLLLAMSSLEPAALNYFQLRTSDQEGFEKKRLQFAQSGPLARAVTKCVELLPFVGSDTQKQIASELDTALRLSSGIATRVAVADTVAGLCSTCPDLFRFPGSSSVNPSVRLLRAFYFASEQERGSSTKDKMIHAVGCLASICPGASVRSLALKACDRYRKSTGNYDDPTSRKAASSCLRALAVRATNQFAEGGKYNVWERRVLPVAYVGRKDTDTKIASLWNEVWDEGGTAVMLSEDTAGNRLGISLEENLLPYIINECVLALEDVSWVRRSAGSSAIVDLCDLGVMSPVVPNTSTSIRTDLNKVLRKARNRAESSSTALNACITLLTKPRIWTGKATVVTAAVKLASKWTAAKPTRGDESIYAYGWDEDDGLCPWIPVSLEACQSAEDLFVGDHWFLRGDIDASDGIDSNVVQPSNGENDVDAIIENGKLSIDDLDVCLDDDDNEIDTGNVVEKKGQIPTLIGLCRFLLEQAFPLLKKDAQVVSDEMLPYRSACLRGFRDLLQSLPEDNTPLKIKVYEAVSSTLVKAYDNKDENSSNQEPPVLVAGAIDCLASCLWYGIGASESDTVMVDIQALSNALNRSGGKLQSAWTVRESSSLCLSVLARTCHLDVLRKPIIVSSMMNTAAYSLTDQKFWRVRLSGLKIIEQLTSRAGTSHDKSNEKQLILESLLPQKERIVALLRKALGDIETSVTALSSTILLSITWWP